VVPLTPPPLKPPPLMLMPPLRPLTMREEEGEGRISSLSMSE